MWTKKYGKTGKDVSVIAFGGMRFPKPEDIDGSAELVTYAHSKGINYFDTAPYYCNDKSEDIMGAAIKQMRRDSFYISTKCGDAKEEELRKSLERSLKRLNVDQIDFFHIWCLTSPKQLPERIEKGAVGAAVKAKEEGLIKHLVVSTHLNGDESTAVLDTGYFEGMTIGYNALNFPFRAKALEAAGQRKLGVVTMNPLGGGLIPSHPDRLGFIKGPKDRNLVEAAIRFNISQPAITAALVGFSSKQHIDEAVEAVKDFTPYSADHIERVKSHITASFEGFCTGCGYCLPCPADLEIPKLMDAYNMKILEDKPDSIKNRLAWHWDLSPDAAAACEKCGDCEGRCTQHLPIRERLEAIASLVQKTDGAQK
jgi:predicted aldo/keto reductase-like oxidoreductase